MGGDSQARMVDGNGRLGVDPSGNNGELPVNDLQTPRRLVRTRCGVIDPQLGPQIFDYRLEHGYSQAELAQLTQLRQSMISKAERGLSVSLRVRAVLRAFLAKAGEGLL